VDIKIERRLPKDFQIENRKRKEDFKERRLPAANRERSGRGNQN
jgi:hypothetical protein